jgi:hypothetical protein
VAKRLASEDEICSEEAAKWYLDEDYGDIGGVE